MEIIAKYLKYMMEKDASDIYFTVGSPPAFRVEGIVNPYADTPPLTPDDTENIARAIMTERQRKKFEEEMEMNLALYSPKYGRFRVNIFRQKKLCWNHHPANQAPHKDHR